MSASSNPAAPANQDGHGLRVLFSCIGRRVELLRAFRRAAEGLDCALEVHAADAVMSSPAMHLVDHPHIVPSIDSGQYIEALLEIVRTHRINLLVPLIDNELTLIAESADRFHELGCTPLISSADVVRTCRDKMATFHALQDAGIDTPQTFLWTEAITRQNHDFPYFLKPRTGSAGLGSYIIQTRDELHTFGLRVVDAIVQEFVEGAEHTLDVYTGFDGVPLCVVPRKRLEVRTGEVSKGLIVRDPAIMEVGARVARTLGDSRGVITVQCIVTDEGRIRVIEINPRFGGGVPLAIHAGADFPRWILAELLGRPVEIDPLGFRDDVAMLRYDDSVFVSDASKDGIWLGPG